MTQINIDIHHLTRVEGHGNIILKANNGIIEEVRWEIPESPRFFEAMLRGRHWDDVAHIASRICGICAVAHHLVSLQATEAAFGVILSPQTKRLRQLLYDAEMVQSHILHIYFLVAPDLLGTPSVLPLITTHRPVVLRALSLKKLFNELADAICGRKVHPISCVVGGFSKLPSSETIHSFRGKLMAIMPDLEETVSLFSRLGLPEFHRETEYISLKSPHEYALLEGSIHSSDAGSFPDESYLSITNEFCVAHSTAKYTRHLRDSYMVGALARFNNSYDQLSAKAKAAAKTLGLKAPCHNPFMITFAQLVETIHCTEHAIHLIDDILKEDIKKEEPIVVPRAGRGISAVEAPRGILFHDYTYDERGRIVSANCIIPTNQNHNNIQKDLETLAPKLIKRPANEARLTLEMLVRAYDPCISCSTH
ncbi:MAG: Ni/Fe hydrogenase subunit alpha [Dehalococcoidia bacterium]|nr:Ni/Fe hydrogenase subunit alpha [Dehalococcoidia bacterium]